MYPDRPIFFTHIYFCLPAISKLHFLSKVTYCNFPCSLILANSLHVICSNQTGLHLRIFNKGKVQKKKLKKIITSVSFMYVCVAENAELLVFFYFFLHLPHRQFSFIDLCLSSKMYWTFNCSWDNVMKWNVFFFCVLHIFQNFPCTLGEKSKSVSFLRVYVCVKAQLTLVIFFYFFLYAPFPNVNSLKLGTSQHPLTGSDYLRIWFLF